MAQATKTMTRTAIAITVLSAFLFAIVRADLDPEHDPTSKLGRIETHALKVKIEEGKFSALRPLVTRLSGAVR